MICLNPIMWQDDGVSHRLLRQGSPHPLSSVLRLLKYPRLLPRTKFTLRFTLTFMYSNKDFWVN